MFGQEGKEKQGSKKSESINSGYIIYWIYNIQPNKKERRKLAKRKRLSP